MTHKAYQPSESSITIFSKRDLAYLLKMSEKSLFDQKRFSFFTFGIYNYISSGKSLLFAQHLCFTPPFEHTRSFRAVFASARRTAKNFCAFVLGKKILDNHSNATAKNFSVFVLGTSLLSAIST